MSLSIHNLQQALGPGQNRKCWERVSSVEEFCYMIGTQSKTTHGGCSSAVAFIINNGHQTSLLMNYSSQGVGIQRAGKA